MFKDELYRVIESTLHDNKVIASIKLCPEHEIFKGHFPGLPILPGVCTLNIIKDILNSQLKCNASLVEGDNLKFLALINPNVDELLKVEINIIERVINRITIACQVSNQTSAVFKMKGVYSC